MNNILRNLTKFLSKESPNILTGIGITGVITTTILAVKATPKALYLIDLANVEREDFSYRHLTNIEIAKLTWKCYIPTILTGTATIACILGANTIHLRRNAALGALYAITEASMREYQEKVIEMIGKGKEEKLRDDIAQDHLNKDPVKEVVIVGNGETLFYDDLSGRYFKANMETIKSLVNQFNKELLGESFKTLNEFYDFLNLEPIAIGRDIGWEANRGLLELRYTAKIATNDQPCIVLEYKVEPKHI